MSSWTTRVTQGDPVSENKQNSFKINSPILKSYRLWEKSKETRKCFQFLACFVYDKSWDITLAVLELKLHNNSPCFFLQMLECLEPVFWNALTFFKFRLPPDESTAATLWASPSWTTQQQFSLALAAPTVRTLIPGAHGQWTLLRIIMGIRLQPRFASSSSMTLYSDFYMETTGQS